jgi:hypothetical protein
MKNYFVASETYLTKKEIGKMISKAIVEFRLLALEQDVG